jgi:hypothetical protein
MNAAGLNAKILAAAGEGATAAAVKVAVRLTALAREAWDSGVTPYGSTRKSGTHGPVDLKLTGRAEAALQFRSDGPSVSVSMPKRYMKYLIGRFGVLPAGGQAMPQSWADAIEQILIGDIDEAIGPVIEGAIAP